MRKRSRAVAVACAVALLLVATATPAAAAQTTVELDAALSNQTESDTLSFTFRASQNGSVSATESMRRAGGDVTFEFDEWENLDGGDDGSGSSWAVTRGDEYRVEYEVTVESGVDERSYEATAEVESGGSTIARERLAVAVEYRSPEFGTIGTQSVETIFRSGGTQSTDMEFGVPNDGRGTMVVSDLSFTGLPSGISVDSARTPSQVDPRSTEEASAEFDVSDDVDEGTYRFTGVVTDSLDNQREFSVEVTVRKPAVATVDDDEIDLGGVLVGSSKEVDVRVDEAGGFSGIEGMDVNVHGADSDGALDAGGLASIRTDAGGSDTASVRVSANDEARQHADLDWEVELTPTDRYSPSTTVDASGRVIYPARLDRPTMSPPTLTFDEPRSTTPSHSGTVEVTIPNEGDLDMSVTSVTASSSAAGVSASVADTPDTVGGLDEEPATVRYTAESSVAEGTYPLTVTVDTDGAGSETIERELRVEHEVDLAVERSELSYGEVTVTSRQSRSVRISERLGYERIEGLTVERVSGPEKWLTVVDEPSGVLTAGSDAEMVVAVQFDTDAELYQRYEWRFNVSGDGVETEQIRVSATPKPYSFDRITDPLQRRSEAGGWQARSAGGIAETLETVERQTREGEAVSSDDLSRAVAAGRSTLLFINATTTARAIREDQGPVAAHDAVVRAAVARDLMVGYTSQFESEELRRTAAPSVSAANDTLESLLSDQRATYRSRLEGNVTALREAQTKQRLAELALIQGETQRGQRLREESNAAYQRYTDLVQKGNRNRQRARELRSAFRTDAPVVVLGHTQYLNPGRLDPVTDRSRQIRSHYTTAIERFEAAGATEEADSVRQERQQVAASLQTAQYGLYGATGVYALVFLFVLYRTTRNGYAYIRDANAAVTGEFLL